MNFTIEAIAVHPDCYISYKVGNAYRSSPVVAFAVKKISGTESDLVPLIWSIADATWKDGRDIPGFLAVVKTRMLETHYQATEADLTAALNAMKRVRQVLAGKLPQP